MTGLGELPPLREVIARHGLSARKSLGQNFLLDLNLTGRIARAAGPLAGVTVIEVGPGPGGLTRALLAEGAAKLVAIERDERCLEALKEIAACCPGRLEIVSGDALKTDYASLAPAPVRIVGNLPYNIATPLLTGWLSAEPWPPFFDRLVLMFQLEVAERIAAAPGSKAYGRLAVLAQWRTRPRILFTVSPRAFVPAPNVTSALVELEPQVKPYPCRRRTLERLTAAAFGQRRKMLRSSLKGLGDKAWVEKAIAALEALGIAETARAETVSVEQFCAIARALDA
ncbi:MAG: 16S rRNA (adenine(1518)-N(6)/adenine(1519)-N(6))-dimethyltransferase RsmA [Hyphomicrobiales bacterium]|nr:16S rRNA (adenine(1518)-N(6)/adenine(1519)-N(6))-dimethyltransferase RsmA [Hyphomicrobiales bacterium]